MISRRRFIEGVSAMGIGAALGTSLPFSSAQASQGEGEPKKGGHLIVGIDNASSSDRLDPAFWFETYMYFVGSQLFNNLLEIDENGALIPSLARAWESPDRGKSWVIDLREDVLFHDGRKLTARDVVYSLNYHRTPDSSSPVKVYLDPVTAIEATGSHQVTISLAAPDVDFISLLASVHFVVTAENEDFAKGIGTGAFILEDFQPGVRTLVRRNPDHWNPARGHVDSVETLAMNDATARVAALVSGSVQLINRVEKRVVGRLESMPNIRLLRTRDSQIFTLPGLSNQAPFDNLDARLALKYAIDRQQIIDNVLGGYASLGNDNPVFPSNAYFAADLPQRPYDPDRARFHWQKAGFSGPLRLSAADAGFPGSVDAAQLYQQSARRAGIELQVERVPDDGYWENIWRKHVFVTSNWSNRPSADGLLSMVFTSGAAWNESFWQVPSFDALVSAARGEADEQRRRQLYHDIQEVLVNQSSTIIPLYADSLDASSARVKGITATPGFPLSGNRAAEKAWLEA